MEKMRVHELAKELGVKSAEIVEEMKKNGKDLKAASSIEGEDIEYIRTKLKKSAGGAKAKDDEKKEAKPKTIITSKGAVRIGEKSGERRKRRHRDGEHRHHRKKSEEAVAETAAKTQETVVEEKKAEPVVEAKTEVKEEVKVTLATEPKAEVKEPVATAKPEKEEKAVVEPKKEEPKEVVKADNRKNVSNDKKQKNDKTGNVRNGNRNDRNNNRNDRNDRNGNDRNGNRNGNRNDRNDRNGNRNDRNNNRNDRNDRNRNDRNGNRNDRNDRNNNNNNNRRRENFRDNAPVASEPVQDKNRKSRENKIRQDKKERNKKFDYDNKRGNKTRNLSKTTLTKPKKKEEKKEEIKIIEVPDSITIGQLAERMKMTASTIIKKLFLEGKMVTVNTEIDYDSAEEIAMSYDIMCEKEEKIDIIEELLREDAEDEALMKERPPVVCVMGHVDHGKTSLLDAIRESNVISGEAGGITQHIGASVVQVQDKTITFLDTPGHEAFTSMRMRGAQSTDIAILVVAADDGVMPQTVEAINHAKAANIEIIVAINKMDKPGANIDRVKQGLAEHGLVATDWGGNVEMVPVSAHTKEGIPDLLDVVLLQAEILELKANPDREARGIVIEAKLDKGKGPVATVLVQKGTLKIGAHIAAGSNHGHLRAMVNDKHQPVEMAGPSTPVEILGLNGVPNAGEVFVTTKTAAEAKDFANTFIEDEKAKLMEKNKFSISLDDLNSQIKAGELKELDLIIKADVQGSVEAVKQSLIKLSNDEVEVKVIHGGVGAINESDVILASASNAIIIGFNIKPDAQAEDTAKRENVDIRLYSVIYNAIDDIERAMKGMLEPIYEEKVIGHAEIRQIFKASGVGNIAGSYVLDGNLERGCKARITRDGDQIFDGDVASLKRFQDDVKTVKAGYECGLVFDGFSAIAEGDQVEAYMMVEVPR